MARRRRTVAVGRSVMVNGLALNARQERSWRGANDDVDSGDFHRMKRGLAALAALEAELAQERAAISVRDGLADTVALERARGEKIEVSGGEAARRRVRVRTRDGLESLQRGGTISDGQYRAGLLYRDLYEAADPERDLKSQMSELERRPGAAALHGRAEAWAERRLRLSGAIAALEAKVRNADRNGHAVRALREVAGHARCLSHFVRGGGAQASYRRALILALDVCANHFAAR